ncbi:class I SAM-dependent methyltransferase [Cryobacterium arcticum]|uniref:Methyltransferase type 11 n=1 Tax=Cryobacterium arcticum TaxID=670052 RepID=A0A1B1BGQ1_9MICO|nr:class I SAM-dependent methyltransferase [Cryobacterium arcticum]ANP71749.1 Methyltransferase type 11 [Cryobacterium arcticum]
MDHTSDHTPAVHTPRDPRDIQDLWDQRYAGAENLWSGQPNATLVAELEGMRPGRILDVGCGEGADALWLAAHGWDVTALDVSQVALNRASERGDALGLQVRWLHAGLAEAELAPGSFDVVSAQYPALLRTDDAAAERALIDAVAPNGVLLVVHHSLPSVEQAAAHGFHPEGYVSPADVAARLDDSWTVEIDEIRPRHVSTGAGAHHTEDVVLRARRQP